ncbi:hypothetical protein O181_020327 [Austropuccinia psidii MF-1]|uniref:Integrase catalytic domain-containing protein n=1 Tax=Austropuccinia psidii MF-1 TaxID=1389203 RepID=A0A9Q3GV81_9BASI|nr:hypothetical protein [Austropuccinia psidii MF-1]
MLGTKLAFSTACHPQIDGLAQRMIQNMEDKIRRFCAYGMEYKDHEGYTDDWVTLLPEVQLFYNTGLKKIRDSFVGTFNTTKRIGENAVEVQLTEGFSRKHPVFPVNWVKPYFQTEENKFPSMKKNPTQPEIVEVEDSPFPVKKIIKARKIILNGRDQRQYSVRFKSQTADKYKWLEEEAIPD